MKWNNYKLGLDVLTPLHIGSGEELDRLSYIISGRKLCLIDYEKIVSNPSKASRLSAALDRLLLSRDNRAHFEFASALKEIAGPDDIKSSFEISKDALKILESPGASGLGIVMALPSSGDSYYLPGSSIKGAIRTAVLNWSLVNDASSGPLRSKIREMADELNRTQDRRRAKELSGCSGEIEERYSPFRDREKNHFRNLMVSDILVPSEAIYIDLLSRRRLKEDTRPGRGPARQNASIPVLAMMVRDGVRLTGKFSISTERNPLFDKERLFKACNDFYREKCAMKVGSAEGMFFLQIGRFCGAITKTFDEVRAINTMPIGQRKRTPFRFRPEPTTRFFVDQDIQPGWVACELEEA